METNRFTIIKKTFLSKQPQKNSGLVAVLSILLILAVSEIYWADLSGLSEKLAATQNKVFHDHEYWRLLTTMIIHADLKHYLSNAFLFLIFSYLLYGYFGFWVFPVLSMFLGVFTNAFSLLTYPPHVPLVGSSGLVYAMAGFWLTMYILIDRSISVKKRLLRSIGVGLILLMPSAFQERVSYRTHAIGFLLGLASAGTLFQNKKHDFRSAELIEEIEEIPEPPEI